MYSIMLTYIPYLSMTFIMNLYWISLKAFTVFMEMIMWLLSFMSFKWWIIFIDLCMFSYHIAGKKAIWSWSMTFLWDLELYLQVFYWEFLHLCSQRMLDYNSFPLVSWVLFVLVSGYCRLHSKSLNFFFPLLFYGTI